MRKVSNKLFAYFSSLVMLVGFFLPNYTYIVNATEGEEVESGSEVSFTNVEDDTIYLDMEDNKSKSISVITPGYSIHSCYGSDKVTAVIDYGSFSSCVVTANNYGKSFVKISYVKDGEFVPVDKIIEVDIEFEEYFNDILNRLPREYEYDSRIDLGERIFELLPNDFNYYYDDERNMPEGEYGLNSCYSYYSEHDKCYVRLEYKYKDFDWNDKFYSETFAVTMKDDVDEDYYYDPRINGIPDQTLMVGETKDIESNSSDYENSNNFFFVSEDNNIARINSRNQLVGISKGTTNIRFVNKKTFEYLDFSVTVEAPLTNRPLVDALAIFEGDVEIDISSLDNYYYYRDNAISIISSYFYNVVSSTDEVYSVVVNDVYCNTDFTDCIIDYRYHVSSGWINDQTASFDVTFRGINHSNVNNFYTIDVDTYYVFSNKENYFDLYNFEATDVTLNYDEEFLQITEGENGRYNFTAIKEGSTVIDFYVGTYVSSIKLEILYPEESSSELIDFYQNLNSINVPFIKENANLNLIECYVAAYIKDSIPTNPYIDYINVDAIFVKDKNIQLNLFVDYNGRSLFSESINKKLVKLNYNSILDEESYNKLEELRDTIKDEYIVSFNGSVFLADQFVGDDFYNNLINQVPLMHDANSSNGLFDVQVKYADSFRYNNYLFGGSYYDIYIYKDEILVGVDRTFIKTNFVIDRDVFDTNSEVTPEEYISKVIKDITSQDYVVEQIVDNYYKVIGNNTFNVLYDHKEAVKADQVEVYLGEERMIDLEIGQEYQLEFLYNPFTATTADILFSSSDDDVFTVDDNGKITAVDKGHALLAYSDGTNLNYYLVIVGYEGTEFSEELLSNFDFSHFEIEYNTLVNWDSELEFLEYYISSELNLMYDKNYMGIYMFYVEVMENNGTYTFTACVHDVCSEEHEFTFEIIGIDSSVEEIVLNKDESKNVSVTYTEGVLSDLRYSIVDKNIATVDKNGRVTAKNYGKTYLKIYDKKHNFVKHIAVCVELEKYLLELKDILKDNTYDIEYITGEGYSYERNIMDAVDYELYLDGYDLNDFFGEYIDYSVDLENKTVTFTFNIDEEEYEISTNYNFVGLAIEDVLYETMVGERVFPSYATVDGGKPKLNSLNEDICTIEINEYDDAWIRGVSAGLCGVEYSYKGYKKLVCVLVDREAHSKNLFNSINIPSTIDIKLDEYDVSRRADFDYNLLYDFAIKNYFNKFIDNEYIKYNVSDVGVSLNGDQVTVQFFYRNYDFTNGVYFEDEEAVVNINYIGKTAGIDNLREQFSKAVKEKYVLTNDQMMDYMLAPSEDKELYLFSDMVDDIESVCEDCVVVQGAWGMADGDLGIIEQGFGYVIFKNDEPVYYGNVKLYGSFIMDIENIDDHGAFEHKLKKRIHDAYKKHKEKYKLANIRAFLRGSEEEETFEYPIELEYVDSNGEAMAYKVTIDGHTLNTVVSLNFVEKEKDTTIKVEKITLNKENLNLEVGKSFKLVATVSPDNATNKKVKWSSSNEKVVKVVDGNVTAVGVGTATITVVSEDGNAKVSLKVSVIKAGIAGDIDGDGKVNIKDLVLLRKHLAEISILKGDKKDAADFNKDGKVNVKDLVNMRTYLSK